MDVRLVIEHGATHKRTYHLSHDEGVIGRQSGCAIRIPSPDVSRRHCILRVRNGYVTVEDLKSSNGTQLNGEDVKGATVVRPGDRLRIGPVTFIVEYQLTPEAIDRLLSGEGESEGTGEFAVVEEAADEAEVVAEVADEEAEEQVAEIVDDLEPIDISGFELPQNEDLRDILSGLDEEDSEERE